MNLIDREPEEWGVRGWILAILVAVAAVGWAWIVVVFLGVAFGG